MKNKTGGKGHKRQKNSDNTEMNKKTIFATTGQDYGILIKKLGNGIMLIQKPYNTKKDKESNQVLGVVRGKIRKRTFFNTGDLVLISYRDELNKYSKPKVDIIHKYDNKDKREIKKNNSDSKINNLLKMDVEDYRDNNDDEDDFFFDEDDDNDDFYEPTQTKNINPQNRNYDIPSSSEEESDEDDELSENEIDNI
jgi:initiation factor 1A